MNFGTVIILNGTSSSGKTSIVRALQNVLEKPFLEAGIDKFIWMLPGRYLAQPLWDDVLGRASEAGVYGHRLVLGMHRVIEALSRSGIDVIADHVLVEDRWWRDCAELFSALPAYLVGVRCPLGIVEQWEKNRLDRTWGQARVQYGVVHGLGIYDHEVDTSQFTPEECALQIKSMLDGGAPPRAFQELSRRLPKSL